MMAIITVCTISTAFDNHSTLRSKQDKHYYYAHFTDGQEAKSIVPSHRASVQDPDQGPLIPSLPPLPASDTAQHTHQTKRDMWPLRTPK